MSYDIVIYALMTIPMKINLASAFVINILVLDDVHKNINLKCLFKTNLIMSEDIRVSILIKLYDRYFENFVIGITKNGLENKFPSADSNKVKMILNELASNFLISLTNNYYKITVFGIKYLEEENLVDNSKQQPRNEILKILKKPYEENVDKDISSDVIVKKLDLSGPAEILSQMKYLEDEGYLHLRMYLGGSFHTRLTHAGYTLAKGLT